MRSMAAIPATPRIGPAVWMGARAADVTAPPAELAALEAPEAAEPPALDAPEAAEPPTLEAPEAAELPALDAPEVADPPALDAPDVADPPALEAPEDPEPAAPPMPPVAPGVLKMVVEPVVVVKSVLLAVTVARRGEVVIGVGELEEPELLPLDLDPVVEADPVPLPLPLPLLEAEEPALPAPALERTLAAPGSCVAAMDPPTAPSPNRSVIRFLSTLITRAYLSSSRNRRKWRPKRLMHRKLGWSNHEYHSRNVGLSSSTLCCQTGSGSR